MMKDYAREIVMPLTPNDLAKPFSYSREKNQLATMGEFLTSRFPKAALEVGLLVTRPQEQLPLISELTLNELKELTLARELAARPITEVVIGRSQVTAGQRIREVAAETVYGQQTMMRTREFLEIMEEAFADGRVKRTEDSVEK